MGTTMAYERFVKKAYNLEHLKESVQYYINRSTSKEQLSR